LFVNCRHFDRPVEQVAQDLLGRTLRVVRSGQSIDALIIETEAYGGPDDPASHAAFKPGGAARIMWEAAGTIYVYTAYGMYPCLNIVTGAVQQPAAVLLRGALVGPNRQPVNGPGRLGRALAITVQDNGLDCGGPTFRVSTERRPVRIQATPRISISRGRDTLWRFVAALD
jgi:DNA-3-methyladenine glycosylase